MIEILWNIFVGAMLVCAIVIALTLMLAVPAFIIGWTKKQLAEPPMPTNRPAPKIDPKLQKDMEKIAINAMLHELSKQFDK